MIRTILVALDGSALAEQALAAARRLAAQTDAALLLLRAAQEEMAEAEAYLGALQDHLAQDGCRCRGTVVGGDPAEVILATARQERADVIAMGTHGRSGIRRLVLGSVADTVLRHAALPVLLVRAVQRPAEAPPGIPYRRILVPLDGSAAAELALALVAHEGMASAADVVLLRAIPATAAPRMPEGLHLLAQQLRERIGWQTEQDLLAARDYLETVAYTYLRYTIPHFCVPIAYPAKAILDMAAGWNADLIVMTRHSVGHGHYLHGGVAAHVLQHGQVPMLCVSNTGAGTPAYEGDLMAHEVEAALDPVAQPEPAMAGAR